MSSNSNSNSNSSSSWREKVEKARKLHRPSLKNWECDGLYYKFPSFFKEVSQPRKKYESFILSQRSDPNNIDINIIDIDKHHGESHCYVNIPMVIDCKTTSRQDFVQHCESKKIPTVIRNIPYGEYRDYGETSSASTSTSTSKPWPAIQNWSLENLNSNPSIYRRMFKVGEDDDGKAVKL